MRLYVTKVNVIAREIIKQLTDDGDIELNNHEEATLDIEAVLKEYIRLDREITEESKDLLERRGLSHGQFGKVKRRVAERKGVGQDEEAIVWICNQILETFMQSNFVEEVYADDPMMRRKMREIMRKHMMVDTELDAEVRDKIKNLQEGTATWDVEYAKIKEQIRHKRRLD